MARTKQIRKDKTKFIPKEYTDDDGGYWIERSPDSYVEKNNNYKKEIESLNDDKSILYEKGLERTNSIDIDSYIKKEIQVFTNKTKIIGPKKDLIEDLNTGQAQNQYRTIFKKITSDNCDICESKKSKQNQLDRAHCNKDNCDRKALIEQAIDKYYVDDKTPILKSDIIKEYLLLHKNKPIFMLCKICHTQYDKK